MIQNGVNANNVLTRTARIRRESGISLIELMIVIVLSSFVTLTTSAMFTQHMSVIRTDSDKDVLREETINAFMLANYLLRHAEAGSVNVQYLGAVNKTNSADELEIANKKVQIDFSLPAGFPVWPNDTAPFSENHVRLRWSNTESDLKSYAITIATAASSAGLSSAVAAVLAGGNTKNSTRIVNLDVWPLSMDGKTLQPNKSDPAAGGYLIGITGRTSSIANGYTHPLAATNPAFKNYRTYTTAGTAMPRN